MRKTKTGNSAAIIGGVLYFEDVRQASMLDELFIDLLEDKHTKAIRLISLASEWKDTYWNGSDFVDASINLEMTLRPEIKAGVKFWYAYRRAGGKLQKRYVGKSEMVTARRLAEVANKMQ